MGRKPRQPERSNSSEGAATPDLAPDSNLLTPLDQFRSLARRLTRVGREELAEQERLYGISKRIKRHRE